MVIKCGWLRCSSLLLSTSIFDLLKCFQSSPPEKREEGKEEPFHGSRCAVPGQQQRAPLMPLSLEHQSTPPNALLTPCSPFYHIIVSGVADNNFFYYNISFLCPPTIVSEHTCTDILLLFYHMSSSPVLEPPELPGVAALPADPQQALLALVQQLKDGQTEQTKLINKLQKTVLTSRTMIN